MEKLNKAYILAGVLVVFCVIAGIDNSRLYRKIALTSQSMYLNERALKRKEDSLRMYKEAFEEISKRYVQNIDSLVKEANKDSKKKISVDSAMLWIERYNSRQ